MLAVELPPYLIRVQSQKRVNSLLCERVLIVPRRLHLHAFLTLDSHMGLMQTELELLSDEQGLLGVSGSKKRCVLYFQVSFKFPNAINATGPKSDSMVLSRSSFVRQPSLSFIGLCHIGPAPLSSETICPL